MEIGFQKKKAQAFSTKSETISNYIVLRKIEGIKLRVKVKAG